MRRERIVLKSRMVRFGGLLSLLHPINVARSKDRVCVIEKKFNKFFAPCQNPKKYL